MPECMRCHKDVDTLHTKNGILCFSCVKPTDLKKNGYWSKVINFNVNKTNRNRGK